MQERKDHVQAYQFATARLSSALVSGNALAGEPPLRRSGFGALLGVVVAALLCGGFYVYGLISPGGATAWQLPRTVVVEKETGNRYLYIDGVLYPTLNSTSAILYWGPGGPPTFSTVSRNSLAGVPHGRAVGIPGAPDSVPTAGEMLPGQWAWCAAPGTAEPRVSLVFDPARAVSPLAPDQRLVVSEPDGRLHVVWRDVAFAVPSPVVLSALGLGDVTPVGVPPAWLDALRRGPALVPPDVPAAGRAGPAIGGEPATVGQVFDVDGQTFLLHEDGLAPVSRTVAALLAARPGAAPRVPIRAADVAAAPMSVDRSGLTELPDLVGAGTYRPDTEAVCVRQAAGDGDPLPGTVVTDPLGSRAGVSVPVGHGMLAAALPKPRPGEQVRRFLITDQGIRFPLTDSAAQALVGGVEPVWLPAPVLDSLRSGPVLATGPVVLSPPAPGAAR